MLWNDNAKMIYTKYWPSGGKKHVFDKSFWQGKDGQFFFCVLKKFKKEQKKERASLAKKEGGYYWTRVFFVGYAPNDNDFFY